MEVASRMLPRWSAWLATAVVAIAAAAALVAIDPIGSLRSVPPVEALAVERVVLDPGMIELHVRNDGPDDVRIAQVLVDDAYWNFTSTRDVVGRLQGAVVRIEYPWREAIPLNVALLTSTGLTFEHEIASPAVTPAVEAKSLLVYAALGVYIGVIPVAVGLLWFPAIARASRSRLAFFLALTAGLLAFLLVDTVEEGLELAGQTASALNGVGLFFVGALGAVAALTSLGRRSATGARTEPAPLRIAYLIAAGIGLHNLGEGLAVGASLAAGEFALGTSLIVGFALHNTTEGIAIVSPLGGHTRPALKHFVWLGIVAGAPTVAGAWLGGFAFTPPLGALAFGVAAGAIAQVVWALVPPIRRDAAASPALAGGGFALGLVVMYATGLLAA